MDSKVIRKLERIEHTLFIEGNLAGEVRDILFELQHTESDTVADLRARVEQQRGVISNYQRTTRALRNIIRGVEQELADARKNEADA